MPSRVSYTALDSTRNRKYPSLVGCHCTVHMDQLAEHITALSLVESITVSMQVFRLTETCEQRKVIWVQAGKADASHNTL